MVGGTEALVGVKMFPGDGGFICDIKRGGKSLLEGLGRVNVGEVEHRRIDGWGGEEDLCQGQRGLGWKLDQDHQGDQQ